MPKGKFLADALEEIPAAIEAQIKAAIDEAQENENGGDLAQVKTLIRGDRARPRPDVPALWIFPRHAEAVHQPRALAETWHLRIDLVAVVRSEEPAAGQVQANRLAAAARSAVLADRGLGLRDFVQDTRSEEFDPSGGGPETQGIYAAAATVRVAFLILEEGQGGG